MNAEELLAEVEALGVEVLRDGDVLRLRPGSALPDELLAELRAHKPELLELVALKGWPDASRESVRQHGSPEARLYPFLGEQVVTTHGTGQLLGVTRQLAWVRLTGPPPETVGVLPSDVYPPNLSPVPNDPFEHVH